jgi:hypothetical protein
MTVVAIMVTVQIDRESHIAAQPHTVRQSDGYHSIDNPHAEEYFYGVPIAP